MYNTTSIIILNILQYFIKSIPNLPMYIIKYLDNHKLLIYIYSKVLISITINIKKWLTIKIHVVTSINMPSIYTWRMRIYIYVLVQNSCNDSYTNVLKLFEIINYVNFHFIIYMF